MSYQAVIRDAGNALVTNHAVGMRISILLGSVNGTAVYTETQTPTTNANGLVSIEIGGVSGFDAINWAAGSYFIKTETDPTGGTNYTITGVSQILSVPYALYSKTAKTADYSDLTSKPNLFDGTWSSLTGKPLFATVATSGNYYDLIAKPTLFDGTWTNITGKPTTLTGFGITDGMSNSHVTNGINSNMITNWNTAYGWGNHASAGYAIYPSQIGNSGKFLTTNGTIVSWGALATVAITGSYIDLTNKPVIPNQPTGNQSGDMMYWNGTTWIIVPVGSPGQYLQLSPSSVPIWTGATYPSVTTGIVSLITTNTANVAGNVSNDGGASVTSRGICYNLDQNPTIANSVVASGTGTGGYFCTLPDLTSSTKYYVRSFATNSVGTSYGNEINFTTLSSGESQTVTDIEGNIYKLITIGSQIWLSENLRTKKFNNRDSLFSLVNAHTGIDSAYGRYYNYYTVTDLRGICPTGFRVPSMHEFEILASNYDGKGLASASGWDASTIPGTVGYDQHLNNSSGFNAIPSGNASYQYWNNTYYYSYDNWKRAAGFWTTTGTGDALNIRAFAITLYYTQNWIQQYDCPKDWTFCVRCIKN